MCGGTGKQMSAGLIDMVLVYVLPCAVVRARNDRNGKHLRCIVTMKLPRIVGGFQPGHYRPVM